MDTLSFQLAERGGGLGQTRVIFRDFIISGKSIYVELTKQKFDYVSCLGWVSAVYEKESRQRLQMQRKGEMPKGKVGLYVCPECVDPLCGAMTVSIKEFRDEIIWSKLSYDNGWEGEDDMYIHKELDIGPFRFKKSDYFQAIKNLPDFPL